MNWSYFFIAGQKIKKKSRPKKLVKSNKSISRKKFVAKFHFLQFQKWPKINIWTGKKLKMQFHEKKIMIYLISRVFCLEFLKFSGPLCVRRKLIKERMYCKREGRLSKKEYYRYLLLTLNRIKKISHNTTFLSVFLYIQYTQHSSIMCMYFFKILQIILLVKEITGFFSDQ